MSEVDVPPAPTAKKPAFPITAGLRGYLARYKRDRELPVTYERMLDFLTPVFLRQGDELFGCEQTICIHCPRCGAKHTLTREALEAHAKKAA